MHEIVTQPAPVADFALVKQIGGFDTIKSDYPDFLSDESRLTAGAFDRLFFPRNEAELGAVLREMNEHSIPVTIAGARTGLVGGSVPLEGAVISLESLNRIDRVYFSESAAEWHVILQPAVNLAVLAQFLKSRHAPDLETHPDSEIRQGLALFKQDPHEYFYPPDPTEMSASIGGTVATNASGARAYRYGPTRAWVRGIRVMLVSGETLDIPRGKYFASPSGQFTIIDTHGRDRSFEIPHYPPARTKNAAGLFTAPEMDLIDLFIGSEGILGVITRVEVAMCERKNKAAMIQFLDSETRAVTLVEALREAPQLRLDFLEFYSRNALEILRNGQKDSASPLELPELPANAGSALFFEMDYDPDTGDADLAALEEVISACGGDMANSWAGFDERDLERFRAFRHQVPETINRIIAERKAAQPDIHKLGTDLAVPDGHLAEMWALYQTKCRESGLEWCAFGHIGNNHIHVNILPHDTAELLRGLALFESFARKAVEFGGTVSAEHGIGKIKQKFLTMMYTPEAIDQMRRVKAVFDPRGILNRGNMLPG